MTHGEFLVVMAGLEVAIGKKLEPNAYGAYFKFLGDLPANVFQIAADRVVLEHPWATFPQIAELRNAAGETMKGTITEISPAEAWRLAWQAAARIDLEIEYQRERWDEGLPPLVREAMIAFGLPALIYGKEPVGVIRGQFMKIYEQLLTRERRLALMPLALREQIKNIGQMPPDDPRIGHDPGLPY